MSGPVFGFIALTGGALGAALWAGSSYLELPPDQLFARQESLSQHLRDRAHAGEHGHVNSARGGTRIFFDRRIAAGLGDGRAGEQPQYRQPQKFQDDQKASRSPKASKQVRSARAPDHAAASRRSVRKSDLAYRPAPRVKLARRGDLPRLSYNPEPEFRPFFW